MCIELQSIVCMLVPAWQPLTNYLLIVADFGVTSDSIVSFPMNSCSRTMPHSMNYHRQGSLLHI
jgi:hypothetical protein